ncbi:unknown [Prevotella sp. CAG:1031]|nr:unknown [Prevotella sp. CAG:1031]
MGFQPLADTVDCSVKLNRSRFSLHPALHCQSRGGKMGFGADRCIAKARNNVVHSRLQTDKTGEQLGHTRAVGHDIEVRDVGRDSIGAVGQALDTASETYLDREVTASEREPFDIEVRGRSADTDFRCDGRIEPPQRFEETG